MLESETRWIAAVAVVLVHEGKVLALRRAGDRDAAPGAWETISGRVERDETIGQAASRETREETGLDVVLDSRPVAAYVARRAGEPMVVVVMRGTPSGTAVRRSVEHDAHEWLTADEMASRCPFPELVDAIRVATAPNVTTDRTVG